MEKYTRLERRRRKGEGQRRRTRENVGKRMCREVDENEAG